MPLPYTNDRRNQLRVEGNFEALLWPRFKATRKWKNKFVLKLIGWAILAAYLTSMIDIFHIFLFYPFLPLLLDGCRHLSRFRNEDGINAAPTSVLTAIPLTETCLLVVTAGNLLLGLGIRPYVVAMSFFFIWRLTRLTSQIHRHYLDYLLEDHRISVVTRQQWRKLLSEDQWPSSHRYYPGHLTKSDHDAFDQAFDITVNWRKFVQVPRVVGLVMCVLAAIRPAQNDQVQSWVVIAFVVLVPHCLTIWDSPFNRVKHVLRALGVWVDSPAMTNVADRAPWTAKTRFGPAEQRQSYLFWSVLQLSAFSIPIVLFMPFIPDYPFTDATNSNSAFFGGPTRFILESCYRDSSLAQLMYGIAAMIFCGPVLFFLSLLATTGPLMRHANQLFDDEGAFLHERITPDFSILEDDDDQ